MGWYNNQYTRNFQQVRFFVKFALQLHEMKLLRSYVIDGRLVSIILSIALSWQMNWLLKKVDLRIYMIFLKIVDITKGDVIMNSSAITF